jgi:hypothetical protein
MTLSERKRATVYDLVRAGQALHDAHRRRAVSAK